MRVCAHVCVANALMVQSGKLGTAHPHTREGALQGGAVVVPAGVGGAREAPWHSWGRHRVGARAEAQRCVRTGAHVHAYVHVVCKGDYSLVMPQVRAGLVRRIFGGRCPWGATCQL